MAESRNNPSNLESPAWDAVSVSPGTSLGGQARALYIGGAGNVEVVTLGGTTVTFMSVPAGTILPVRTTLVDDNTTTATNIVALF